MALIGKVGVACLISGCLLALAGCADEERRPTSVGQTLRSSTTSAESDFNTEVERFREEIGAEPLPRPQVENGVAFAVPYAETEKSLRRWTDSYLPRGTYVFRFEMNFGYGGRPDIVVLLPTTDQFEIVRAAGTSAPNFDISNQEIIEWLRDLNRDQPFQITGAGIDYVEGWFKEEPTERLELSHRFYRFCPDIVDQGTGTVVALAHELASGYVYCWWD